MYKYLYTFLIILAILSAVNAQNKSAILKNISVTDDIFFTSLFVVIILAVIKLTEKEPFLPVGVTKSTKMRICVQTILVLIVLFLGGILLSREETFLVTYLKKPIYLIVLLIYSIFFMNIKINFYIILGVILTIIGCYLVEGHGKKNIR